MAKDAERAGTDGATLPSNCRNCAAGLTGVYCSACGESHLHGRLELGALLSDVLDGLVNLDTRVLRTIGDLSVAPGQVVRDYLDGRRVPYINPFKYALATFAFAFAVAQLLGWLGKLPSDPGSSAVWEFSRRWGQTVNFVVMPSFALAIQAAFLGPIRARGALGSARPLRWIEAYVLVLFALGQVALLQGLLTPFLAYLGLVGVAAFAVLPVLWTAWAVVGVCGTPWWSTLVRVVVAFVLGLQLPAAVLSWWLAPELFAG